MFYSSLSARHAPRRRLHRSLRRPLLERLEQRLVPSIPDGTILVATAPSPYASADQSSFPAGIIGVDPSTGSQFPISVGGSFSLPTYIAEAADQQLYISDLAAFGTGAVLRVDPNTGQQSVLATGGYINGPNAISFINGFIYVANEGDASGNVHNLVRIDPRTGAQTLITSNGGFLVPTGMAPAPGNSVYLSDELEDFRGTESGKVWKINLDSGKQTLLSQGGLLDHPVDIAFCPWAAAPTGTRQPLAVRAEGHHAASAVEGEEFMAGLRIPHLRLTASAGQAFAVRAEGHVPDGAAVPLEGEEFLAGLRIPPLPLTAPFRPDQRWPSVCRPG